MPRPTQVDPMPLVPALPPTPHNPWDHLRLVWLLRILARCNSPVGSRRDNTVRENAFLQAYDALKELTGVDPSTAQAAQWLQKNGKWPRREFIDFCRRWLTQLETEPLARVGVPFTATASLCRLLDLDPVEGDILLCAMLLEADQYFPEAVHLLGDLRAYQAPAALEVILGFPAVEIRKALSRKSLLAGMGLVELDTRSGEHDLHYRLDVLDDLERLLTIEEDVETQLFERFLHIVTPGVLQVADFSHISTDFALIEQLLRAAAEQRISGVNVLIYGAPGTGKTELVRTLAAHLGFSLYAVNTEDEDGDPRIGQRRVSAYQVGQRLLRRRRDALLLFDEVEDVTPPAYDDAKAYRFKGWLNQVLEQNPAPAFWVCNSIDGMDPAFLRRFDYILRLDVPPRAVRERMLHDRLGDAAVSPEWRRRMATLPDLTPALIARAARVEQLFGQAVPAEREARLERILGHTLQAMGQPHRPHDPLERLGEYDLGLLNTDLDLERLVTGLRRYGEGRLCLYGPPGTGKSAFAAHLAERLERPLVYGTTSELLDMYIGETEKRIAALFSEAENNSAVLLLDEADSLLRDRRGAVRSWEVTQVNELLLRMERFPGVLVCATNLMEHLDPAVLRRFDFKLHLRYLDLERRQRLCRRLLGGTLTAADELLLKNRLPALDNLTPGDFAVVQRKLRFLDLQADAQRLLDLLTEESRAKPDARRTPVGFVG